MESGSLLLSGENSSSDGVPAPDNTNVNRWANGGFLSSETKYSLRHPCRVHNVHAYESSSTCDISSTCTCFQRTHLVITRHPACKIVFRCICFVVSAVFLLVGLKYRDGCPLEPGIPVFLSVEGAVLTLLCVVWTLHGCCDVGPDVENSLDSYGILIKIQVLFLVLWTVTGSVWIYSEQGNANLLDSDDADYCQPLVYWLAFGLVTFTYAAVVLGVLVAACVCLCVCLCEHVDSTCISGI